MSQGPKGLTSLQIQKIKKYCFLSNEEQKNAQYTHTSKLLSVTESNLEAGAVTAVLSRICFIYVM